MAAAGKEAAQGLFGMASGRVVLGAAQAVTAPWSWTGPARRRSCEVLREQAPFAYSLVSEEAGMSGLVTPPGGW